MRYAVDFQVRPSAQDGSAWTAVNLEGEKPLLNLWNTAIGQLYRMRFSNYLKNPEIKQKLDQLRF